MGRPAHGTGAPATLGWLLVLGTLLAGLFAMHGLADHGSGGSHAMPGMSARAPDATDHTSLGTTVRQRVDATGAMNGTCLAFLALVLLLLADLAGGRHAPSAVSDLRTRLRRTGIRVRAPPTLELLSVRRC